MARHPRRTIVVVLVVLAVVVAAIVIFPRVNEFSQVGGNLDGRFTALREPAQSPPEPPLTSGSEPIADRATAGTNASENASEQATAAEIAKPEASASATGEDEVIPESASPAFATERIVLLAPQNPLILEFQFTIDGRPHTEALEALVDEVLKLADTDGDSRPMWKELTASKRFKYGQFGNLAINNDNDHKQIVEKYDIDRDNIVDRLELPRFLTRNAGGARAFSIRGSLDHRDINRRGAPTWQLVDADGDGALSSAELAGLAARLAARDLDDDEMIAAGDLNPRAAQAMPGMMAERRRRGPDAARLLGLHADWESVRLTLENRYSGSALLTAESFPLTPELFAFLDANGDGQVRRDEISRLQEAKPHVLVAVDFGEEGDGGRGTGVGEEGGVAKQAPRLRLVKIADSLAGSGQDVVVEPNRLTIRFGAMVLTIYTNDTVVAEDFEARAQQALAALDANKDGYLEKTEVPENLQAQLGQFEAVDANEDGKVYPGEIVAFLRQQQAAQRAQIHAKAGDREDALFAVLDADHDERLTARELESAGERLTLLDRDGDGQITPDELPEAMVIGLARGNLENADALFRPPPAIVRGPAEDAPRWFTSMDANADGAISQREFIGPAEKFAELDTSGDGLLEVSEIGNGEGQPEASAWETPAGEPAP